MTKNYKIWMVLELIDEDKDILEKVKEVDVWDEEPCTSSRAAAVFGLAVDAVLAADLEPKKVKRK